jgi:hypothetical protein
MGKKSRRPVLSYSSDEDLSLQYQRALVELLFRANFSAPSQPRTRYQQLWVALPPLSMTC